MDLQHVLAGPVVTQMKDLRINVIFTVKCYSIRIVILNNAWSTVGLPFYKLKAIMQHRFYSNRIISN